MQKCDDEEHGIEVGNDAGCTNNGTPSQTHGPVGNIVGFTTVRPPATGEKTVTRKKKLDVSESTSRYTSYVPMSSLNVSRILDDASR